MPNLFSKRLHLCFFKLKYPNILSQPHPSTSPSPSPASTTFHFNTTFTPHSHFLYETTSSVHSISKSTDEYFSSASTSSDSDSIDLPPPDLASLFASQRFFFSSPGSSNSIIESPDTRPCNNHNNTLIPRGGGVRVPKYSVDPYVDFLRSMQEMIDSRQVLDVRKDWDYLHELLLCYLALNPTHTHKYIVRAFTDLVVDLLSSSSSSPPQSSTPCRMHKNRRQTSFPGREVGVKMQTY